MGTRIGWDLTTLAALLLSFALSMVVSWVYVTTYIGLSYVRELCDHTGHWWCGLGDRDAGDVINQEDIFEKLEKDYLIKIYDLKKF